jgi:hypothetical protein
MPYDSCCAAQSFVSELDANVEKFLQHQMISSSYRFLYHYVVSLSPAQGSDKLSTRSRILNIAMSPPLRWRDP